jgi:hypothetical protein
MRNGVYRPFTTAYILARIIIMMILNVKIITFPEMKVKPIFYIALLLIPFYAKADWIGTSSVPTRFTIKNVQFASGVVKFWVNEYDQSSPTTFYITYPSSGGVAFEEAKVYMSLLLTAYSTGKSIHISVQDNGSTSIFTPVSGTPNLFTTIKVVD